MKGQSTPEATALAKRETGPIAKIDAQSLLKSAVENGAGIEALERLVALAKDVKADAAKSAWYEAMAEFQRTCPTIKKAETAQIRTRSGSSFGYSYAALDTIVSTILPIMGPLGLSVAWRTRFEPNSVVATCIVSHVDGHREDSGEVAMPIVLDGDGASPPQRVGIATTYAKRYSLLAVTGLAPEDDTDGGTEKGEPQGHPRHDARPTEKPKPREENQGIWSGELTGVSERSGVTNKKPWTIFVVLARDGTEFGTFSDSFKAIAEEAASVGDDVEIEWTRTAKGNLNIEAIAPIR